MLAGMKMIEIRNAELMPTRPCQYCLAMQDDSVFADFEIDQNGCLYLIRISFDGYGCCHIDSRINMSQKDSETLIEIIKSNDFSGSKASKIISDYFKSNSNIIWQDALKDHDLI